MEMFSVVSRKIKVFLGYRYSDVFHSEVFKEALKITQKYLISPMLAGILDDLLKGG